MSELKESEIRHKKRVCNCCRKEFEPTVKTQKYCSTRCSDSYYGKSTYEYEKECECCHKDFKTNDLRTLYCSNKCKDQSSKQFCLNCSQVFERTEEGQEWCSDDCKKHLKLNECKKCHREFYHKNKKAHCSDQCKMRECECCSKKFVSKFGTDKYCSEACKRKMFTHTCMCCEKEFYRASTNSKFCSRECQKIYNKSEKKYKVCKECKVVMRVTENTGDFCSIKCQSKYTLAVRNKKKNKKKDTKSDEEILQIVEKRVDLLLEKRRQLIQAPVTASIDYWQVNGFDDAVKKKVLERDHHHCIVCESGEDLEIHHVLPRKLGGGHNEENLATLCTKCHRHIETGDREHAIKKCFENAKKNMGTVRLKMIERLDRIEQINIIEKDMSKIYEQMVEHRTEDFQEAMILMDNLFEEIDLLKKNF